MEISARWEESFMIRILSSLIILIVNLMTTAYVAKRKRSRFLTYAIIAGYTVFFMGLNQYLLKGVFTISMSFDMLTLLSWTYLLVFMIVYDNDIKTLVAIMAFSFSHTLLINGFVYHGFILAFGEFENYAFILVQLIVFSVSTPFIILVLKKSVKNILTHIGNRLYPSLYILPITNFIVMFVLRFYVNYDRYLTWFVLYGSMLVMIALSYYLIYHIITGSANIKKLSRLAYIDPLTGLNNRLSLYRDFNILSDTKTRRDFYFMDLDRFKTINDNHGHQAGDRYLQAFAHALGKTMKSADHIYRISGDEFVIIDHTLSWTPETLNEVIRASFRSDHAFLGVSIGKASFPDEEDTLDDLLNVADQRMYHEKRC